MVYLITRYTMDIGALQWTFNALSASDLLLHIGKQAVRY